MSDTFGLATIPLSPPQAGQPTTDPTIQMLLDFFTAFLNDDQNATAAWQIQGVAPSTQPVMGKFPYDPEVNLFHASTLPALYLWRESGKEEWLADDYMVEESTCKMLWVFPLANPENQAARVSFASGLCKALNVAMERGRTPSWVVPNDPDPVAATQGSFLGTYLGAWSCWFDNWRRTHVIERGIDGSMKQTYVAVELMMTLTEQWSPDITDPSRSSATSALNGVDAIVENATGTPMAEGHLAGTPVVD